MGVAPGSSLAPLAPMAEEAAVTCTEQGGPRRCGPRTRNPALVSWASFSSVKRKQPDYTRPSPLFLLTDPHLYSKRVKYRTPQKVLFYLKNLQKLKNSTLLCIYILIYQPLLPPMPVLSTMDGPGGCARLPHRLKGSPCSPGTAPTPELST